MILDFNAPPEAIRVEKVGGKFYHLYHLNRLPGLRVPPAFCVTEIPEDHLAVFQRMGDFKRVAVRSSAAQEDLPGLTAAGIFESYLDLEGPDAVWEALKKCFQAAGSDRVRQYLSKNGLDPDACGFAAVIQEMVPAEKAGVLFTVNPVNGKHEFFGEMVDGLGEALVSGSQTPRSFSLDPAGKPTDDLMGALWEATHTIEKHYQTPQDIEWAWAGGKLFILQSRPIVIDPPQEAEERRLYPPHEVWTRANIGEIVPRPLTPFSWAVFQEVILKAYRIKYYSWLDRFLTNLVHLIPRPWPKVLSPKKFNEVLYLNLDTIFKSFGPEPYVDAKVLELGLGFQIPERAEKPRFHPGEQLVRGIKTILYRLELLLPAMAMENRIAGFIDRYLKVWQVRDFPDDLEKLFFINRFLFGWHIAITARSFSHLGYLLKRCRGQMDEETAVKKIIAALGANNTDPYFAELSALKALLDTSAGETGGGEHFNQRYQDFLQRFGHRTENEFELAQQAWGENESALKAMIEAVSTHQASERQEPAFPKSLEPLLRALSKSIQQREHLKSLLIRHYRQIRATVLSQGRQWTQRGLLSEPEAVFFMTLEDLRGMRSGDIFDVKTLVEKRQASFRQLINTESPYLFYGATPPVRETAQATGSGQIRGVGCSTGVVSGRAVVLTRFDSDVAIEAGDIIVTPSADPGWTPLLMQAGGMVTEIGGILSHVATIARENGLPFIVGAAGATQRIRNGQQITIDGGTGAISLDPIAGAKKP